MDDKIYLIRLNYDFAIADIVESMNNADSLELTSETPDKLKNFKFNWLTNESEIIPDSVIIISELIGGNSKFTSIIKAVSRNLHANHRKIGNETYDVFSNITTYEKRLNLRRSKITRFSNGDIMDIKVPILLPGEYNPIFKLEEMPSTYFCTSQFKDVYEKERLTGFVFEECKVKSKSWF